MPFTDDVEDAGANYWLADSPWARTNADSRSPDNSWTDSPEAYYGNTDEASLTLVSPINLSGITAPQLKFWHHYRFEAGYDFGYVEISTSDGASWNRIASYSGSVTNPAGSVGPTSTKSLESSPDPGSPLQAASTEPWVLEQLSLAAYAGEASVLVRFRIKTDATVVEDGWYLDDIAIADLPAAVVLDPVSGATKTSLGLSWSTSDAADFASYKVIRSESAGVTLNDTVVATLTGPNSGSYTDAGLPAKTIFHYKVFVATTAGIYGGSNEVSGTTLPGIDYPFRDDMESAGGNWNPEPIGGWTWISPASAYSGTKAWTASAGGDYGNNVDSSLVLSDAISLKTGSQLVFWHLLDIAAGDVASVEVSTNDGTTWNEVASYMDMTVAAWTQVQVPLGHRTDLGRVRFRMMTDAAGGAGGWTLDDVSISDLPTAVVLESVTPELPPNKDQMALKWSRNNDVSFGSYQVRRDTSPGVDLSDTLVRTITDPTDTGDSDTGLNTQTTYHYKVFVVNPHGAVAASNELSGTTFAAGGLVAYPHFDDMESGRRNWALEAPWALTDEASYSGNFSWTESPGADYANNVNASLTININLGAALMPVLSFRHIYSLQESADWVVAEVSSDGGSNWTQVFSRTGGQAQWTLEMVDLGSWAGQQNVLIRFRMITNTSITADGWHVDDVRIGETPGGPIPYPFFDDAEGGTGSWVSGPWEHTNLAAGHSGVTSWNDNPNVDYHLDAWSEFVLSNVIDLSSADDPMLTFWHKYDIYNWNRSYESGSGHNHYVEEHDRGRVYVSTFFGKGGTWEQVGSFYGVLNQWTRVQINLSKWVGSSSVRLKFVLDDSQDTYTSSGINNHQREGWYLDDIRIQDSPDEVVLQQPTNVTMHGANLRWSQNTEANFGQYEVRRSTGAVDLNSTLVATITDQAANGFMDVYSILQPDFYHYKVWVLDDLGRYSPASNEVVATYTVPQADFPFFDDMEGSTGDWEWGAPWGRITTGDTGDTGDNTYWSDSPVGPYDNDANTALTTYIDLALAASPVLTFRHKTALEQARGLRIPGAYQRRRGQLDRPAHLHRRGGLER